MAVMTAQSLNTFGSETKRRQESDKTALLSWEFAAIAALLVLWLFCHPYFGNNRGSLIYTARALADLDPGGVGQDAMFRLDGQSAFTVFTPLFRDLTAAPVVGEYANGVHTEEHDETGDQHQHGEDSMVGRISRGRRNVANPRTGDRVSRTGCAAPTVAVLDADREIARRKRLLVERDVAIGHRPVRRFDGREIVQLRIGEMRGGDVLQ